MVIISDMSEKFGFNQERSAENEVSREKGEGRRLLHELEATGEYVFHGSHVGGIDELEPRQPYDWKSGSKKTHGDPSVVATPFVNIAIFRSVVYEDFTSFGVEDDGQLTFKASQKALDAGKKSIGYVYVLKRSDFSSFDGDMDWRASTSQKPERIVSVTFDDLPEDIGIIEKE